MNIMLYVGFAVLFIMSFYFMFNDSPNSTNGDFGIYSITFVWVIAGIVGYFTGSMATALGLAIITCLIFV